MFRFRFLSVAVVLICSAVVSAQDSWEKWGPTKGMKGTGVLVRAGYTIGGTTPLPLPNEVRAINEFSPKGGATIGVDVYKMFCKRWGASVGWHFFYEGFHTSADVKNYKMTLTQDGNTMSGYFTGTDVTNTSMWGMTMPFLATLRMSPRWNFNFGPYFSTYFKRDFSGTGYENKNGQGYLRVDDPTGEKVNMDRSNAATYDFTENMLQWNAGLEFGFDWKACRHMNVFVKVDWGLTSVFESSFDAIAFKMYPIYATFGLAYRY